MPLVMYRKYNIPSTYNDAQKAKLIEYIDLFRGSMGDDNPDMNILNGKVNQYNDSRVLFFLNRALKDLNSGIPRTTFTLFDFPDTDTLIVGANIFALIAEGILQLRNQVDFSDSGLSVNLFNKTGGYQGWAGMMLQGYMQDKAIFKSTVLPTSARSGFLGVGSEFGYSWR